jgi:disease resistance protein RPM1
LFLKRIFGSEEGCPSDLSEVCDDILKKCDGLPLAIIAIAGLLAGKAPTIDEWNKVQRSFVQALERQSNINRMIQILSLSYFDLPPHLRSCLLYLSIFPEDYKIRKDRLILRWIAEGFIHEEHGFTQYELGERCLNELINRSLILPVDTDFYGVRSCRVHDIILEFILSKAVEENFITLVGVPNITVNPHMKIRRLSLQDRNEVRDALVGSQEKIIYYHARAISVFSHNLDILPSLQRFRHVRVLDLEKCTGLRTQAHRLAHLGRLFALRYLSLRDTGIRELPEEIGELQHLQTLNVLDTKIREMPSSVGRLARLVTLLCGRGVQLPDGFGRNMQALQWLGWIDVSIQSPSFAEELCQLRNLQILDVIVDDELSNDLASSLCTLGTGCLSSLTIYGNEKQKKLVVEPWSPTQLDLKILKIWWFVFPRVPIWIGSLDNLRELNIFVEQFGVADFGLLGSLNALSGLHLIVKIEAADRSSSSQGTQRLKISGAHGFPSLRRFQVGSNYCALGLVFEAGAMPKLQELILLFDEDKTGSLTDGEFDFGIQHLPCLALVTCYLWPSKHQYEHEQPVLDALNKAISSNPNHPKLCHNLRVRH